ncbi:MAG: LysO family transporter [Filifactoraceae bacterium]
MLQTIMIYLFILVVGALIGRYINITEKRLKLIGDIQFICLLVLLFFMGANLGLDKEVLKNFGTMGFNASLFSLFTIGFSVLGIFFYKKIFMKDVNKFLNKEDENDN